MKICPDCALSNEECFPACVVCHASLADVRSTPSPDPAHPEHARRALDGRRRGVARRQVAWAAVCYGLVICGLAVWPGMVFDPQVQLLYAASALIVALAAAQDMVGPFRAAALQATASGALMICFGSLHPFVFFMFAGHVLAPMLLCHWVEMIHDANR